MVDLVSCIHVVVPLAFREIVVNSNNEPIGRMEYFHKDSVLRGLCGGLWRGEGYEARV